MLLWCERMPYVLLTNTYLESWFDDRLSNETKNMEIPSNQLSLAGLLGYINLDASFICAHLLLSRCSLSLSLYLSFLLSICTNVIDWAHKRAGLLLYNDTSSASLMSFLLSYCILLTAHWMWDRIFFCRANLHTFSICLCVYDFVNGMRFLRSTASYMNQSLSLTLFGSPSFLYWYVCFAPFISLRRSFCVWMCVSFLYCVCVSARRLHCFNLLKILFPFSFMKII